MGSRCFVGTHQCHQAISRSQTSARPPRLLPSWLAHGDSWAAALQPVACLILLYFVISLFLFHFFFNFIWTTTFYARCTCSTRSAPLPIRISDIKSKHKSRNGYHLYYNLNEFLGLHFKVQRCTNVKSMCSKKPARFYLYIISRINTVTLCAVRSWSLWWQNKSYIWISF